MSLKPQSLTLMAYSTSKATPSKPMQTVPPTRDQVYKHLILLGKFSSEIVSVLKPQVAIWLVSMFLTLRAAEVDM